MLFVTSLYQCVTILEALPQVFQNNFFLQEILTGMVWDMHAHLQHTAQHWYGLTGDSFTRRCLAQ